MSLGGSAQQFRPSLLHCMVAVTAAIAIPAGRTNPVIVDALSGSVRMAAPRSSPYGTGQNWLMLAGLEYTLVDLTGRAARPKFCVRHGRVFRPGSSDRRRSSRQPTIKLVH